MCGHNLDAFNSAFVDEMKKVNYYIIFLPRQATFCLPGLVKSIIVP